MGYTEEDAARPLDTGKQLDQLNRSPYDYGKGWTNFLNKQKAISRDPEPSK